MKATMLIFAAVLSLQVSILFAENNESGSSVNSEAVSFHIDALAPVTPVEADFEESFGTVDIHYFDLSVLAPVTPEEADFNENIEAGNISLSPVTPDEADFE